MNEWIQKQIDNGFADLKGLSIKAHVPVKDQLLNEFLAEALHGAATPVTPPTGKSLDLRSLIGFVRKAEVHSTDGALVVDVDIAV